MIYFCGVSGWCLFSRKIVQVSWVSDVNSVRIYCPDPKIRSLLAVSVITVMENYSELQRCGKSVVGCCGDYYWKVIYYMLLRAW